MLFGCRALCGPCLRARRMLVQIQQIQLSGVSNELGRALVHGSNCCFGTTWRAPLKVLKVES